MTVPTSALPLAEALIRVNEGFRSAPYRDSGGVWTIGSGLTRLNGEPVNSHTPPVTTAENDLALGYELGLTAKLLGVTVKVPLTSYEWAALASFTYNVGGGAFYGSTLLRKLNAGDKAGAALQFAAWNKCGGRVLAGLVNRRAREAAVFRGQRVQGVTDTSDAVAATAVPKRNADNSGDTETDT